MRGGKASGSFLQKRTNKLLSLTLPMQARAVRSNYVGSYSRRERKFIGLFLQRRTACLALSGLLLISVAACKKEDMYTQRTLRQWDRDPVSPNGAALRAPVPGTLAQEQPDKPAPQPHVITTALLARGQSEFNVFCSPCHAASGNGEGMIVQRGFPHPPAFTTERLMRARAQVVYDAITNGHGAMYSYAARVPPADRWAIASYVRALQLSQAAPIAQLPAEDRQRLAQGVAR